MKNLHFLHSSFMKTVSFVLFMVSVDILLAQNIVKAYAIGETHSISTACLNCEIINPESAVGNDGLNYSTLKMGAGLLGNISQTLLFPTVSLKKLHIPIGTNKDELSLSLLNSITIETFKGNSSNMDSRTINGDLLKIGPQKQLGAIEFIPTKPYDRVKISLNAGVLTLNSELYIFYASQAEFVTQCATIPVVPDRYYPFNSNSNDVVGGLSLNPHIEIQYQDDAICGKALKEGIFTSFTDTTPMKYGKTVSFWAKAGGTFNLNIYDNKIRLTPSFIAIQQFPDNQTTATFFGSFSTQKFEHYSVNIIPKYRNSVETFLCQQQGGSKEGCSKPTGGIITLYKNGSLMGSKQFISQPDIHSPDINASISIDIINTQLDELAIYHEPLPELILKQMPCYYNVPGLSCSGSVTSPSSAKTTPDNLFTITPNPTSGPITIDSDINIENADLFISNISGKEVYRSKLVSKTFDIPATLRNGIYLLTVSTKDGKILTRKVILTK